MTDHTAETYDGDVTLTGHEDAPVEVRDPEDVYLRTGSVEGDLELRNPEYVFTHQPTGDADVGDPETVVRGNLEDGYAEPGGVTGDAIVADAEDVFVSAETSGGDLSVVGPENVYADDVALPRDPDDYDVSLTGWKQSGSASDPDAGVRVAGADHEVSVEKARTDLDVYVVGRDHEIEITGRSASVSVYLLGYDNTVRVGAYLDSEVVADTGFDNEVISEPYPVEDLIETSKDEAFDRAGFGRRKVTYQVPAEGDDWCPNCGEPADAIVERHQMEALFVFGRPVKTYDRSTNPAKECEHCSRSAFDASLTERERKDVLK
ncbi:hypothetical protein [Halorussus caseinilyticus]|uniref:Adhesin domain-containing protein n=1 Tax=Halorussus caseinilyticus TaxID=3034025 RepID=A0ABD5WJS0_9EURY|nr:hypothetical protein [Halorussus sp. DT72]